MEHKTEDWSNSAGLRQQQSQTCVTSACNQASSCDRFLLSACAVLSQASRVTVQMPNTPPLPPVFTKHSSSYFIYNMESFLTLKFGCVGESETCWVFEHSSGIGMRIDNALQEHCHVRDFVCCQLFQCSLQRPAEKYNYFK